MNYKDIGDEINNMAATVVNNSIKQMTRLQTIREYERVNRAYEVKFLPRIQKAIHAKVEIVINKLKTEGIDATINYLHTDITNPAMAKEVEQLYLSVGLYYARSNYSRMLQENGRKGNIIPMQAKGFGFSELWHKFISDYFRRYLLQVVTLKIAHTTRDALLQVLIAANAARSEEHTSELQSHSDLVCRLLLEK